MHSLRFASLRRCLPHTVVALSALLAPLLGGCVVVPQNRRQYLADPTMQSDPLEARARDKLHTSREAASGGNGQPAGGGCGCGN
ncbi:MAG: DUF4266 domain-containing protein [Polyangiaceae bacterium]